MPNEVKFGVKLAMASSEVLEDFRGDAMDPAVTRGHRMSVSAPDGLFEV